MEVIERELGYQTMKPAHNPKSLSSFLKSGYTALMDLMYSWQQAVEMSASLLLKRHFIEWMYLDRMLGLIEK